MLQSLFKFQRSIAIIFILLATVVYSTGVYADSTKIKYDITVTNCDLDFIGENYCDDDLMSHFAYIMQNFTANFANDKMLYIYKSVEEGDLVGNEPSSSLFRYPVYSMVLMDRMNRTVTPFIWTFMPANNPVNKAGDYMQFIFHKDSNEFCYKGYMNSMLDYYSFEANPSNSARLCFDYDETDNSFSDMDNLRW